MGKNIESVSSIFSGGRNFALPLLILFMLSLAVTAFAIDTLEGPMGMVITQAVNDVTVTISPGQANCDELGNTFTLNVKNELSNDHNVYEVRVYQSEAGIDLESFSCGPAPLPGWTLSDYVDEYGYCEYKTSRTGAYIIKPGQSLNFTFSAVMVSTACKSIFWVSSLDSGLPMGDHEWEFPEVSIDCTAPIVAKNIGKPRILLSVPGCNEGPFQGTPNAACDYWITQNTNINVTATDSLDTDKCNLGLKYCQYRYKLDGGEWSKWAEYTDDDGINFNFQFQEDSVHDVEIECYDVVGNKTSVTETDKVDTTAPTTKKNYGLPFYTDGKLDWATSATPITLTATDGGAICAIGVDYTKYRTCLNKECYAEYSQDGSCSCPEETPWIDSTGVPFTIAEDSEHCIQFYSTDKIYNTEKLNSQCVYIDNLKPTLTKTVGAPAVEGDGEIVDYWVTQNTPITLTCEDQLPHPVGNTTIMWTISVDGGEPQKFDYVGSETTFNFAEDSVHVLDAWCQDALGNQSAHDIETFKVDTEAPKIDKTMLGTAGVDYLGECPPKSEKDVCYVADNGKGGVSVNATDGGEICAVDNVRCGYRLWWHTDIDTCKSVPESLDYIDGRCLLADEYNQVPPFDILFHRDSTHDLELRCSDALGNEATDNETFLVDSTPPVTTKTYGDPHYPAGINEGAPYPHWITTKTPITLAATDNKVRVDKTYYRYCLQKELPEDLKTIATVGCRCGDSEFEEYSDPFTIGEESQHCIEFYSKDLLGNTELVKSQIVYVEDTPPIVTKTVGDPKVVIGDKTYISQQTPITLSCKDPLPHPVNNVSLEYRYRLSDDCETWGEWSNWNNTIEQTIYFTEDSCHQLEYKCKDALGNTTETYSEIDVVDTKAPVITTEVVGPQIVKECPEGIEQDSCLYIDGVTVINVSAVDPEPHPVDTVTCNWDYVVNDGNPILGGEGVTPPFKINFPEESVHYLRIMCSDALGNESGLKEMYVVDKSPPVITKEYKGPYYSEEGKEWINSTTDILMSAVDPEPHPSGLKSLEYRVSLVNDTYCANQDICQQAVGAGEWKTVDGPAKIGETSCHLIEIKAIDNVEKTALHKQCVFVDNEAPLPLKTVGDPKAKWTPGKNGQPGSIFYPAINETCWGSNADTNIECWKIPMLTPISLQCNDPAPHPVDHSSVCFNVEWDATDITEKYCREMQGQLNDKYCCIEGTTDTFYFAEETEHNLKYYCVDALGNTGPIDDEKFKVEGTPFTIELNKKWNLISVPFVLIDSNITTVLKDIKDDVDSVWNYDAATDTWFVYRPSSPETSNLKTLQPGKGYWLAAYEPTTLVIGGSLFSPITTPPEWTLKKGWNMIGYYGTDGIQSYTGPSGYTGPSANEKQARCELYSLGSSINDKGWTSLLTYWEPYNPYQWSASWNYVAEQGKQKYDYYDYMNPGAGYWISVPEDGLYSYTTTCGGMYLN